MVPVLNLAGSRSIQPAEDIEQCRLATSGGAQQDDELAGMQFEIDIAERVNLGLAHAVDLRHITQAKDRFWLHCFEATGTFCFKYTVGHVSDRVSPEVLLQIQEDAHWIVGS